MSERKKIAAIITVYRKRSHADVLVGKYLQGEFPTDDGMIPARSEIASIYLDQVPDIDTGIETAKMFDVPVYESINKAMCLGGNELAVDGVLSIGEHDKTHLVGVTVPSAVRTIVEDEIGFVSFPSIPHHGKTCIRK